MAHEAPKIEIKGGISPPPVPPPGYYHNNWNRAANKPGWMLDEDVPNQPDLSSVLPPERSPAALQTPESIIASGPVPEITPAFLGLRSRIARWKIGAYEAIANRPLSRRETIGRHVGEQLLKGKGYYGLGDPLRPSTFSERLTAYTLDHIHRSRKRSFRKAHVTAAPYFPLPERKFPEEYLETPAPRFSEAVFTPQFDQDDDFSTPRESRAAKASQAGYDKLNRKIGRRDRAFSFVISPAGALAERSRQKRAEEIRKLHALENTESVGAAALRRAGKVAEKVKVKPKLGDLGRVHAAVVDEVKNDLGHRSSQKP